MSRLKHESFTKTSWGDDDDRKADLALYLTYVLARVASEEVMLFEELNEVDFVFRPMFRYIEELVEYFDESKNAKFSIVLIEYAALLLSFDYSWFRDCYHLDWLSTYLKKLSQKEKAQIRSIVTKYIPDMYGNDSDEISTVINDMSEFLNKCK
jgi:phenylpyruvate tautomerase PptA (4-oxalocrotonate tautomerase family)